MSSIFDETAQEDMRRIFSYVTMNVYRCMKTILSLTLTVTA